MAIDPFLQFKQAQREGWASIAPLETLSAVPAAKLVRFARITPGDVVLDVACGTGPVGITAARAGARVYGLDLSPVLLELARKNATIAGVELELVCGDAEALPYPDAAFDVVLSQFGHIFAPRPEIAVDEIARVLKPGGRLAFSTWPPELFTGRFFAMLAKYSPAPPAGALLPAPPPQWGDPKIVRERLAGVMTDLVFDRDVLVTPALSPQHARLTFESTISPLTKLVAALQTDPARLAELRAELDGLLEEIFVDNHLRQHFLMTRATRTRHSKR